MHDSKPPASDGEGQARDDESQDAAKIPARPPIIVGQRWRSKDRRNYANPVTVVRVFSSTVLVDGLTRRSMKHSTLRSRYRLVSSGSGVNR